MRRHFGALSAELSSTYLFFLILVKYMMNFKKIEIEFFLRSPNMCEVRWPKKWLKNIFAYIISWELCEVMDMRERVYTIFYFLFKYFHLWNLSTTGLDLMVDMITEKYSRNVESWTFLFGGLHAIFFFFEISDIYFFEHFSFFLCLHKWEGRRENSCLQFFPLAKIFFSHFHIIFLS